MLAKKPSHSTRIPLALLGACALLLLALGAAGCTGDDDGGGDVATVKKDGVSKSQFNAQLVAIQNPGPRPEGSPKPPKYDPPNFDQCVEDRRNALPKPTGGQQAPQITDDQLKEQCKAEYQGLKDQAMQQLLTSVWTEMEAKERGIDISDDDAKKQFEQTQKAVFPNQDDLDKFRDEDPEAYTALLLRTKTDLLTQKIREQVVKPAAKKKVSAKAINSYFSKNKQQFARPASRDLQVILAKNEADAKKAKQELADGESFAAVAKKYSIDPASKTQGGKLPGFVEGQQDPSLSKAVFDANTGKVYGPIKTGLGYYLFEVTKINNAKTAKLDSEAKAQARALLASQDQQELYNKYLTKFQKKWKAVTVCAKGYIIQLCRNAPKQPTNPSGIPSMPGGSPVPGIPPTGQPNIPTPSQ